MEEENDHMDYVTMKFVRVHKTGTFGVFLLTVFYGVLYVFYNDVVFCGVFVLFLIVL